MWGKFNWIDHQGELCEHGAILEPRCRGRSDLAHAELGQLAKGLLESGWQQSHQGACGAKGSDVLGEADWMPSSWLGAAGRLGDRTAVMFYATAGEKRCKTGSMRTHANPEDCLLRSGLVKQPSTRGWRRNNQKVSNQSRMKQQLR